MNDNGGYDLKSESAQALDVAEHLERKSAEATKQIAELVSRMKILSIEESDHATRVMCERIEGLLRDVERSGYISSFEKRVLEEAFRSIKMHAESIACGYPSYPSYSYILEALQGCRCLRDSEIAA